MTTPPEWSDEVKASLYRIETSVRELAREIRQVVERTARLEEQRESDRERMTEAAKDRGRIEQRVAVVEGRVQSIESAVDRQTGMTQAERMKRTAIDAGASTGAAAGAAALLWQLWQYMQHSGPPQ